MAQREQNKKKTIDMLTEEVSKVILELSDGDTTSIAQIVGAWYQNHGYEWKHLDIDHGYAWTKDGGTTYALMDFDQFEVLDHVIKKLEGVCVLDFSRYDGMDIGLPYNLHFTVRKDEKEGV